MAGSLQDFPGSESDRQHLRLLLARFWAAERLLAGEIANSLEVSEECAVLLARMRIDELIEGRRTSGEKLATSLAGESYCESCWALLTPETGTWARPAQELFAACVYCGQAAYSDDEWQDAA
jgi:hypothetical protein